MTLIRVKKEKVGAKHLIEQMLAFLIFSVLAFQTGSNR